MRMLSLEQLNNKERIGTQKRILRKSVQQEIGVVGRGSLLGPVSVVLCMPLTINLKLFACENNKAHNGSRHCSGLRRSLKAFHECRKRDNSGDSCF
jgi:hypothetical protein